MEGSGPDQGLPHSTFPVSVNVCEHRVGGGWAELLQPHLPKHERLGRNDDEKQQHGKKCIWQKGSGLDLWGILRGAIGGQGGQ